MTFGFHRSRNHCGSTGAYFSEAVGHEYGNAGFQSAVSGCATNCCGGYSNANVSGGNVSYGVNNAVGAGCGPTQSIDPSYGAPMMPNNAYTAPAANGQGVVGDALMPNDAGMNNDAGQTEQPETENLGEIEQLAPNGLIQDDNN